MENQQANKKKLKAKAKAKKRMYLCIYVSFWVVCVSGRYTDYTFCVATTRTTNYATRPWDIRNEVLCILMDNQVEDMKLQSSHVIAMKQT